MNKLSISLVLVTLVIGYFAVASMFAPSVAQSAGPITMKVAVTQQRGVANFALVIRDSAGHPAQEASVNSVQFQVVNAKGAKLYENTFEHG
jgi:hypothetical protein